MVNGIASSGVPLPALTGVWKGGDVTSTLSKKMILPFRGEFSVDASLESSPASVTEDWLYLLASSVLLCCSIIVDGTSNTVFSDWSLLEAVDMDASMAVAGTQMGGAKVPEKEGRSGRLEEPGKP